MIPFGSQTVTLYHRDRVAGEDGRSRDVWSRVVLTGCSWRHKAVQTLGENAVLHAVEITCRIPGDQTKPNVGDVLIFGTVATAAATAKEVAKLLEDYRENGAFRAASVADNAQPGSPLPHYAARGD